jgi:hypothetical protein
MLRAPPPGMPGMIPPPGDKLPPGMAVHGVMVRRNLNTKDVPRDAFSQIGGGGGGCSSR